MTWLRRLAWHMHGLLSKRLWGSSPVGPTVCHCGWRIVCYCPCELLASTDTNKSSTSSSYSSNWPAGSKGQTRLCCQSSWQSWLKEWLQLLLIWKHWCRFLVWVGFWLKGQDSSPLVFSRIGTCRESLSRLSLKGKTWGNLKVWSAVWRSSGGSRHAKGLSLSETCTLFWFHCMHRTVRSNRHL